MAIVQNVLIEIHPFPLFQSDTKYNKNRIKKDYRSVVTHSRGICGHQE